MEYNTTVLFPFFGDTNIKFISEKERKEMRQMKRFVWLILLFLLGTGCKKQEYIKEDKTVVLQTQFRQAVINRCKVTDCYEETYVNTVSALLEEQKKAGDYDIDHPLFILNPYGTTPNMVYIYLGQMKEHPYISYEVKVPKTNIPSFFRNFYLPVDINEQGSISVEGLLAGLIEGVVNELHLFIKDETGTIQKEQTYLLDLRESSPSKEIEQVVFYQAEEEKIPKEGLFCCSVNLPNESGYLFYDNYGILRARIAAKEVIAYGKVLAAGNHLFYASGQEEYVLVDYCGKIKKRFYQDPKEVVQDYVYDEEAQTILVLTCDKKSGKPYFYKIDPINGDIKTLNTNLIQENFHYVEKQLLGSRISIKMLQEGDCLLSGSQTEDVFRINHLYTQPVVRWMLSSNNDAEQIVTLSGTMAKYRGICSISDSNEKKQPKDSLSFGILAKTNNQAWFDVLSVDESYHMFSSKGRFCLGSAAEILSAHTYGKHLIVGKSQEIDEYNTEGQLILSLTFSKPTILNVQKMTMSRYWF